VLQSKTKFKLNGIMPETKPKSPSPEPSTDDTPPITVTLPRGIIVIDGDRQKFVCDYCNNKPLNSLLQVEQVPILPKFTNICNYKCL
jgi:hypothetical protein